MQPGVQVGIRFSFRLSASMVRVKVGFQKEGRREPGNG